MGFLGYHCDYGVLNGIMRLLMGFKLLGLGFRPYRIKILIGIMGFLIGLRGF